MSISVIGRDGIFLHVGRRRGLIVCVGVVRFVVLGEQALERPRGCGIVRGFFGLLHEAMRPLEGHKSEILVIVDEKKGVCSYQ